MSDEREQLPARLVGRVPQSVSPSRSGPDHGCTGGAAPLPLKHKWRRTYDDSDETFAAYDHARFGEHYVANIFRVKYVNSTEAWTWQCLAPGAATKIDPVRLKGLKPTPREAAYEAEQRYGDYLGLITPDELARHVRSAEAVDRGHANWARQNGNREGKA